MDAAASKAVKVVGPLLASAADRDNNKAITARREAEERQAALGRHTVDQRNVSTGYLVGMGAVGGVASAALASAAGCTWKTVALSGAAGASILALGAHTHAERMTPLEHAQYELAQTRADKEYLLAKQAEMEKPDYRLSGDEIMTVRQMANKYDESYDSLWILWAGLFSPYYRNNEKEFLKEIHRTLNERGVSMDQIVDVVRSMTDLKTIKEARALRNFRNLTADLHMSETAKDELVEIMFAYNKIIMAEQGYAGGLSTESLYQSRCQEKLDHFKARLDKDERRLESDIRILQAMAEQQKQ